jgi:nucleotide-binding universal stress UspA family protein
MVPTDGSAESAKAVGIARRIAQEQGAELLLVRVVEPLTTTVAAAGGYISPDTLDEFMSAIEEESQADLTRLADEIGPGGPKVRTALLKGPVESALLDCEASERPDLVVMTTHGRTGIARFTLGSVTDRLVREGTSPVFVIRRTSPEELRLERALMMLDGSGVAEEAIPVVKPLLGKPIKSLRLFRVVRDPANRDAGMTYLDGVRPKLETAGVAIDGAVEVGEARHIIDTAANEVDLVVLCTHGRSGFDRLRHGSVAEYVMHNLDKPALLVRAGQAAS